MVGGVHHGDEDVDQKDDGYGLIDSPDRHSHQVGELAGDAVDVVLVIFVGVLFGAVGVVGPQDCCILRLTGVEDSPEHCSKEALEGDKVILVELVLLFVKIENRQLFLISSDNFSYID